MTNRALLLIDRGTADGLLGCIQTVGTRPRLRGVLRRHQWGSDHVQCNEELPSGASQIHRGLSLEWRPCVQIRTDDAWWSLRPGSDEPTRRRAWACRSWPTAVIQD